MKLQKQVCGNCKYYRCRDSVWGNCYRYPPKLIIKSIFPKIKYNKVRPEVYEDYDNDFCGEFESRKR